MQLRIIFENILFEVVNGVEDAVVIIGSDVVVEGGQVLFDLCNSLRYLSIHKGAYIIILISEQSPSRVFNDEPKKVIFK